MGFSSSESEGEVDPTGARKARMSDKELIPVEEPELKGLSPAEILKFKIARAMMMDDSKPPKLTNGTNGESSSGSEGNNTTTANSNTNTNSSGTGTSANSSVNGGSKKKKKKKNKKKVKRSPQEQEDEEELLNNMMNENLDMEEKIDYERVFRLPKAPDGTLGFSLER